MTTPVTTAEVEALEALYAKTDQGAMWFAADFLDSWTPQASAYIAAALNAMPRLLAALRAQDAGRVAREAARRACEEIARNPMLLTSDAVDAIVDRAATGAIAAGVAALKSGGGAGKGCCDA